MKRFVAVVRRIFLAGTISLVLIIVLRLMNHPGKRFYGSDILGNYYLMFAIASPILGFIFSLISVVHIRRSGYSSSYQQTIPFFGTVGEMIKSDITSPFRLFVDQFASKKKMVEYYSNAMSTDMAKMLADGSKAISRLRFYYMIVRFIIYFFGIMAAVNVLANYQPLQ